MMIEEFEKRTGFYPPWELYAEIEKAYADFPGDKDEFCKAYKENTDGIAEKIQRKVNEQRFKTDREHSDELTSRDVEIERLSKELEREQEWKPYEMSSNVSQADYEELAQYAGEGKACHYMTDEEAIEWICQEFDFNPNKVTILHEIDEHEINRHNRLRKTGRRIDRRPIYCATDYHYIRFNTTHFSYEVWNDQLRPFYD